MNPYSNLLNLTSGVSSWSELEIRISNLRTEMERGEVFEEFCKAFFVLDPIFQFENVYRHKEIPPTLKQRLGYPPTKEIGIDGLAVTAEDKLFAYQAKYRKDRSRTPTLRELSTFFTVSDRADWRITITNANTLPSSINDRTKQSRILADRFDQLDPDFFERLRLYLKRQVVNPPQRKLPHITQQEAIEETLSYFSQHSRGQLILPCGTGKTLAAMWIAEKLGGNRFLVMVPSLFLLSQTLREWAANTSLKPFRYLCLCSDPTVDLGKDSPIEHIYEMDVPVTTDPETVSAFLTDKPSTTSILFSTYQSGRVLSEAVIRTGITFDIGIFDEAHRTTGSEAGLWSLALDDRKVPVHRRLFMTATPRIYAPHIAKKAKENDVLLYSMDDAAVYGKPFYEITFGKAIERDHITDFKVIVIFTTDAEVKSIIQRSGRVIADGHVWDAKAFAKRIALVKGLNAYRLKKVFTFHGSIRGAESFTDQTTPYGINQIFKMLASESLRRNEIKYFHVNGTMPAGQRTGLMKEFREASIGIMSNARCLTEGIDVPAVDTVAFIDPKRSLIDIVQATGRALRKADWKERGYIFIPVVVDEVSDPEKLIESSDFETVWKVLEAMIDQDQKLRDTVSSLRVMQGKGEVESQAWKDAMNELCEKIVFYDLPVKIEKTRFLNNLHTKIIEVIGRSWDFWYGLTLKYKEETGDPNAKKSYKTRDGYPLGKWQRNQRDRYKQGKLPLDRVQRLEEIEGWRWSISDVAFERRSWDFWYGLTLKYKEETGDPNALYKYKTQDGYRLGQWQGTQRRNYAMGKLSQDRIRRLEEIEGWRWSILDEAFEMGIRETLKYKEQTGDPNALQRYKTPDGYNLGMWQSERRKAYIKGTLSQDKIRRLEEIEGWRWSILDEAFERGIRESLKYKEETGDPNAKKSYKTRDGYPLGKWQRNQRDRYKQGKLPLDRVQRLEEIEGWRWSISDVAFEKGFKETLRYKEETGDPNAPQRYKTPDGFALGMWQQHQRTNYKKGKLPPDRVQRLVEIGFKWRRS